MKMKKNPLAARELRRNLGSAAFVFLLFLMRAPHRISQNLGSAAEGRPGAGDLCRALAPGSGSSGRPE